MKRRQFIAGAGAALLPGPGYAQDARKRVGYLTSQEKDDPARLPLLEAVLAGLAERGWEDGRNVTIEYRYGNVDPATMQAGARDLVASSPDALVGTTTPPAVALRKLTSTIPIVFANVSDPVGSGLVQSFAQPGTNATGCSNYEDTVAGKWLELLLRLAPATRVAGMMFNPTTAPGAGEFYWKPFVLAAQSLKIEALKVAVLTPEDIDRTVADLADRPGGALVVSSDVFEFSNRARIAAAAAATGLPAIYPYTEFAEAGGLISYAVDLYANFHRAGGLLGRILSGERPADLPVQGPTNFVTTINLAAARALGIAIPPDLLATATQVIE